MFSFDKCIHPNCDLFKATGDEDYCLYHSKKKNELIKRGEKLFSTPKEDIFDLCLSGVAYSGLTIFDKKIIGSTFAFNTFESCQFENVAIINSFFDFALFHNCTFKDCSIRYSIFSGATFDLSSMHGSTVIHDNFNGANITQSDFSDNDFYYSSFIMARFVQVKLEDCNLCT